MDPTKLNLKKGNFVIVTGIMEKYPQGPALLKNENLEDIEILDNDIADFIDIFFGYRSKA